MKRDLDKAVEDMSIFLIDEVALFEALEWVSGCERCRPHAVISFNYVLDATTGADPETTEYIMCQPATCPACSGTITEKTRITV